jgi:hypothetical protein
MCKSIASALTLVAMFGFVSLAQATVMTMDTFESPTYSLGNLNGQDGWSGTGGAVVAKPAFLPASAGSQSAAFTNGSTATKSWTGFADTTQFSVLWSYDASLESGAGTYWYGDLVLKANDGTGVKRLYDFGSMNYQGAYSIYASDGGSSPPSYAVTGIPASGYLVDVTMDFTAQKHHTIFTDAATSTVVHDFGWLKFENAITLAQAQASGQVTFDIGSQSGGTWNAYMDSSPIPEPSALALLLTAGVSLLAYAWRRRKQGF